MSKPIETMECEGPRNQEFGQHLRCYGPGRKRSSHGCRLQVPAERWRDKVCEAEDVEATGKDAASDSV